MTEQPEHKHLVVMSNELVKQPSDLSLVERRALYLILGKLRPRVHRNPSKDLLDRMSLKELKEFQSSGITGEVFTEDSVFTLTVTDYARICGVEQHNARKELEEVAVKLGKRATMLNTKKLVGVINWTSTSLFLREENTLFIKFNELLVPYLCDLQSYFTKVRLSQVLLLQSTYSWRFYELYKMRQGENRYVPVQFNLEELYEMLDVPVSRKEYRKFNERILKPVLKELEDKNVVSLQVKEVKSGRKVTGLVFEKGLKELGDE